MRAAWFEHDLVWLEAIHYAGHRFKESRYRGHPLASEFKDCEQSHDGDVNARVREKATDTVRP